MNNKLLQMLSICRKAGKIKMGFDPVENSLYEDAYLVVFAQNASKNTVERMLLKLEDTSVPYVTANVTQDELSTVLGKTLAVISITDKGLANQVKKLSEE